MKRFILRWENKNGGSGMSNTSNPQFVIAAILQNFKLRTRTRVEDEKGNIIGEVYKNNGKWSYYYDNDILSN